LGEDDEGEEDEADDWSAAPQYAPIAVAESEEAAWRAAAEPALTVAPEQASDDEDGPHRHQPLARPEPDPMPMRIRGWLAAIVILLLVMAGELTYITATLVYLQIKVAQATKEIERSKKELQKAIDQLP
jgi:hypothetical protein